VLEPAGGAASASSSSSSSSSTSTSTAATVYRLANRGKTEEARAALEEIPSGKELHILSKRRCEKRDVR
jgi:hypothetical protein